MGMKPFRFFNRSFKNLGDSAAWLSSGCLPPLGLIGRTGLAERVAVHRVQRAKGANTCLCTAASPRREEVRGWGVCAAGGRPPELLRNPCLGAPGGVPS